MVPGAYAGSVHVLGDELELEFDDEALEERLDRLLDEEELVLKLRTPNGALSLSRPEIGSDDWVQALLERLERSDFRLFGEWAE